MKIKENFIWEYRKYYFTDYNSCPEYTLYCFNLCVLSMIYKNVKSHKL